VDGKRVLALGSSLRKQMHMFEKKRGAGNEHAGPKEILGREKIKMTDAMSLFLLRLNFEIWLLVMNFG